MIHVLVGAGRSIRSVVGRISNMGLSPGASAKLSIVKAHESHIKYETKR